MSYLSTYFDYYELDIEREILSNENILVDFERKNLEKHDLFNDEDLVEIEDEFGRTIRLPRKKAGMASNFHENTSSDIKEYKPHETTGYHMFPPIEQLSYAQRVQEKQKRDFEAKTEWQDILFSQNEYFDSKKGIFLNYFQYRFLWQFPVFYASTSL